MSIKLKISDEITPFSFTLNSKDLIAYLARLEGVTGYTSKSDSNRHHIFVAQSKKLYLLGYSDTTFAIIQIEDAEVSGKGSFNCPDPARVRQLLKNRSDIEFNYDGASLKFKSVKGKFSGDLNTAPITIDQVPRVDDLCNEKGKAGSMLNSNLLAQIREGVKYTNLTDLFLDQTLLVYLSLNKGRLSVSCYDNYHLSLYEAKVSKKEEEFKMAFPASLFEIVDKFVEDEPANFFMKSKSFRVEGKNFVIGLPPVSKTDEAFDQVSGHIKTLTSPSIKFQTDPTLQNAIDNLMALNADGALFDLQISPKGAIKIQLKTDHGNAAEAIKVTDMKMKGKALNVRLDPRTFNDLIKHVKKGSLHMEFYGEKNVMNQCVMRFKPSADSRLIMIASTS